jgi:hypothetical protein
VNEGCGQPNWQEYQKYPPISVRQMMKKLSAFALIENIQREDLNPLEIAWDTSV